MDSQHRKKDDLDLIKIFLNAGIQVRHVKNIPPMNFGVSDKEVAVTIEKMEAGKMSQSFLISNEPLYINHFNSLFEEIWRNGIDAEQKMNAIQGGVDSGERLFKTQLKYKNLASGLYKLLQKKYS